MESLKLRPRLKIESEKSPALLMESIVAKLMAPSEYVVGSTLGNHAYLKIKDEHQHYWSPELHLSIEETDNGSLLRGVAGPKPKIWTMFMFFYSAVIVLFLFGASLGLSQWSLGMHAPWLWSIPASVFTWLLILGAAKYGQSKGKHQLGLLYGFVDEVLE
ncbi:MAG: hypothetical protein GXO88_02085 [Chlorobi bacterium]|nr:hypothetical protein [Chlorobiota bacterium]